MENFPKAAFYVFIILLFFLFVEATEAIPACTIRSSCLGGETCLFSMYLQNDSHVGHCDYYDNKVCCTEISSATIRSLGCNTGEGEVTTIYQENNTHVGNTTYFTSIVCAKFSTNPVVANIRTACNSRENCSVSVYQENDAHVGHCDYFSNKICVQELFNVTITVNINDTSPTWSGGLRINGKVTRADGTNVDTDASGVNIYVNSTLSCTTQSDSSGDYSCDWNAPNSIGLYQANVTVLDPTTSKTWYNTTTFSVRPEVGATASTEITADNIACYEEPMIVQNPDGTITTAIVRLCVWK
ncbi:MAG: hypothetical protein HYW24_01240 [Candidatus Aenigmarchaeota archaeon]|nr:hypothetical protein [Candidatus Aenigmarchaeota archaeon]